MWEVVVYVCGKQLCKVTTDNDIIPRLTVYTDIGVTYIHTQVGVTAFKHMKHDCKDNQPMSLLITTSLLLHTCMCTSHLIMLCGVTYTATRFVCEIWLGISTKDNICTYVS